MRYCSCSGKFEIRSEGPAAIRFRSRRVMYLSTKRPLEFAAQPSKVLEFGLIRKKRVPEPSGCKHQRTQVIAKDQDAQYVECLDCGEILEADELLSDTTGFDESLSDA
jgi:hypothetical protein